MPQGVSDAFFQKAWMQMLVRMPSRIPGIPVSKILEENARANSDLHGILQVISIYRSIINIHKLVGGLEHGFSDFPFSWECHNPN